MTALAHRVYRLLMVALGLESSTLVLEGRRWQ
jgi:hypothetical protein